VGSEVILFDGSGMEFDVVIEKLSNREAAIRLVSERKGIVPKSPSTGSGRDITLYISLIKKDKLEWVVEKATELGVSKIVPIISERSEKKGFNLERARKIAIEASEQCGRADVPEIGEVVSLDETLEKAENVVVFDSSGTPPASQSLGTLPLIKVREDGNPTSIFIGPEGGWSEKEMERFKDSNMEILSLGKLTLRAETAAVVALAKLQ